MVGGFPIERLRCALDYRVFTRGWSGVSAPDSPPKERIEGPRYMVGRSAMTFAMALCACTRAFDPALDHWVLGPQKRSTNTHITDHTSFALITLVTPRSTGETVRVAWKKFSPLKQPRVLPPADASRKNTSGNYIISASTSSTDIYNVRPGTSCPLTRYMSLY